MVKMITVWYKYNDDGSDYPKPKDPSYSNQEAWKKSDWERKPAYLDEHYQVLSVPPANWIK